MAAARSGGGFGAAAVLCFAVLVIAVVHATAHTPRVVVDAGSSGTRVHLFAGAEELWMSQRDGVGLATAFERDEERFGQDAATPASSEALPSADDGVPETVDVDGIGMPASEVAVVDADAQGVPAPRVRAELRPLLQGVWTEARRWRGAAVAGDASISGPIPVVVLGTAGFRALPHGRQLRAMQLVGHVVEEELARLAAVSSHGSSSSVDDEPAVPEKEEPTGSNAPPRRVPFMALEGAHVLSDALEGPLAWIAVNVLTKRVTVDLKISASGTVTTIDMGGVSLQYCTLLPAMTTTPTTMTNSDASRLRLADIAPAADPNLVLYAKSFFGLGVNAAITNVAAALEAMPKDSAVLQRIEEHTMASIFQGQFEEAPPADNGGKPTKKSQDRHRQRRGNSRGMLRVPPPQQEETAVFLQDSEQSSQIDRCVGKGESGSTSVDAEGAPQFVVMSHLRHVAASMGDFQPGQQDTLRPWGPGVGAALPDGVTPQQYCDNATSVFESVDDTVVRTNRHVIALGYMCTVLVHGLAIDRGATMRAVERIEGAEVSWALGAAILMNNGVRPDVLSTWPASAPTAASGSPSDL